MEPRDQLQVLVRTLVLAEVTATVSTLREQLRQEFRQMTRQVLADEIRTDLRQTNTDLRIETDKFIADRVNFELDGHLSNYQIGEKLDEWLNDKGAAEAFLDNVAAMVVERLSGGGVKHAVESRTDNEGGGLQSAGAAAEKSG